ncbi:MAG TPA: class I SAM-dependent methyltransferase, partial [Acidimicrobiales bacterium]|nr:class I SAM-dependent methyltransferase [Acidimicrobiales bacterium]
GVVLDAGCGTGENALYLATHGHEVVGIDSAPSAIAKARAKAAERGLTVHFEEADARTFAGPQGRFDTVIDSGLFHVFDPLDRPRYVAVLHRVTRPGALVHVLCFSEALPGGYGPTPVSEAELRQAFPSPAWRVRQLRATSLTASPPPEAAAHLGVEVGVHVPLPAWLVSVERGGGRPARPDG